MEVGIVSIDRTRSYVDAAVVLVFWGLEWLNIDSNSRQILTKINREEVCNTSRKTAYTPPSVESAQ